MLQNVFFKIIIILINIDIFKLIWRQSLIINQKLNSCDIIVAKYPLITGWI
jgi:hypothetical protein